MAAVDVALLSCYPPFPGFFPFRYGPLFLLAPAKATPVPNKTAIISMGYKVREERMGRSGRKLGLFFLIISMT
jgi:hypothetical protein